jgi:hypothetical protein
MGAIVVIILSGSVEAQNPVLSNSLDFDHVDDHVTVPYNSSFPVQVFTALAWVRAPQKGGAIISRGEDDVSDNGPWNLGVKGPLKGGTFRCNLEDAFDTGVGILDGLWHHVAATRSASGLLSLYVDGVVAATFANTVAPSANCDQDLTIGCSIGSNSVRLTNAAFSATAGLFFGLSSTPVAFKGGTLKPFPFFSPVILTTDFNGDIYVPFAMPAGIPAGTQLWVQYAIQDAAAINGVSLSNAILGLTP